MSKRLNDRAEAFPVAHPIIVPLRDKSYSNPWVEKIPSMFTCTPKKNENLALSEMMQIAPCTACI